MAPPLPKEPSGPRRPLRPDWAKLMGRCPLRSSCCSPSKIFSAEPPYPLYHKVAI